VATPHDSVLGLTLWKVVYDDLLKLVIPSGSHQLVRFTDELAVVGVAGSGQALEDILNPVLANIDEWMTSNGLELSHYKS